MKKVLTLLIFVFLGTLLWVGIGVVYTPESKPSLQTDNATADQATNESITSTELVIGSRDAKVTIIEYADFKCPECNKYQQNAGKEIRDTYVSSGIAKIVFRPYPLFGADGARALYGSYCAGEQGKFEAYYDAMFNYMWNAHYKKGDYDKAVEPVLADNKEILQSANIDVAAFSACVASKKYDKVYDDDLYKSADDNVQGTPTFVINGQKVVGAQPFSVFKFIIDAKINE